MILEIFLANSRFEIRICNPLSAITDEAKISFPSMYEEPTNDASRSPEKIICAFVVFDYDSETSTTGMDI